LSVLELQKGLTYGPIDSRRLGRSLGINVLPTSKKRCTFDCCYCQYGRTEPIGSASEDFPGADEIGRAVERALWQNQPLDAITFSGNGEPTLHPQFPRVVRVVRRLRDKLAPGVPLVILSNSSLCDVSRISDALGDLDLRIMKLEVGSQGMLQSVNRPAPGITYERIIKGLAELPKTIIQAMFVKGSVDNRTRSDLDQWLLALGEVRPIEVQVYSLDRPAPDADLVSVGMPELESVAELVRKKLHVKAKAYGR
jgi:wyosine [tRNA(Phe)-imidazoG37] synthetase (radical SAM superfamily)